MLASFFYGDSLLFSLFVGHSIINAKIVVEGTIAEADKVAIQWSGSATHKGPFLDVRPTGKRVKLEGITIFSVVKGRVAEQLGELNLFSILRQLGGYSLDRQLPE